VDEKTGISYLAGTGAKRAAAFASLGIHTVGDLVRHFPRAYQNRGDVKLLVNAAASDCFCSTVLTVAHEPQGARLKKNLTITKFEAFDSSAKCTVTFFNQNYIKDVFKTGQSYRFWGKVQRRGRTLQMSSPSYEPCTSRVLPDFYPVYPLAAGLSQKVVQNAVALALTSLEGVEDVIPEYIRQKYSLPSLWDALCEIHRPRTPASLEAAKRYFIFEELFIFALSICAAKKERPISGAPAMDIKSTDFPRFLSAVGFELTESQKQVVREICRDLKKETPMARLLLGDVGSGKTVCAAAAAYITVKNSHQCALMAPTEILARQHYEDIGRLFEGLGIRTVLLSGSLSAKEKRLAKEAIASGQAQFVVGTHALLSQGVEFADCALVICDEQHRFGVRQRASLVKKGKSAHMLVMSATPIPRTLALALYGDLDVSNITELPPGRIKVDTFFVTGDYRDRVAAFIRKQASMGFKAYIVCPSIDAREKAAEEKDREYDEENLTLLSSAYAGEEVLPLCNVTEYTEALRAKLPELKIGLLHGKMSGAEKNAVMEEFAYGDMQVLVSTTVIEVGVNVPSATLMIVENAERFGLSSLHQLRGRVGRGKSRSYCILISDSRSESARRRLNTLCASSNGYEIAQTDLVMRGPGDFLVSESEARQHGGLRFKMASALDDTALLETVFECARCVISDDARLQKPENATLARACEQRNEALFGNIS